MAVLAPTVGPVVGGWITDTLFLALAVSGQRRARRRRRDRDAVSAAARQGPAQKLKNFDGLSLAMMAIALASLEIGLKQAPQSGWFSVAVLCAVRVARRRRRVCDPDAQGGAAGGRACDAKGGRSRSAACSAFCLGVGLFGAVYLMPVFLAYVRQHDALEIGKIMLVTGVGAVGRRADRRRAGEQGEPRWLSAFGFSLFAVGLA